MFEFKINFSIKFRTEHVCIDNASIHMSENTKIQQNFFKRLWKILSKIYQNMAQN